MKKTLKVIAVSLVLITVFAFTVSAVTLKTNQITLTKDVYAASGVATAIAPGTIGTRYYGTTYSDSSRSVTIAMYSTLSSNGSPALVNSRVCGPGYTLPLSQYFDSQYKKNVYMYLQPFNPGTNVTGGYAWGQCRAES